MATIATARLEIWTPKTVLSYEVGGLLSAEELLSQGLETTRQGVIGLRSRIYAIPIAPSVSVRKDDNI
ncbi:MAG TPA: hypothetical protein PKH39_19280 [Woeseiaceae bacterium]|nr:hypothetical protein [Woeseiaceae bacterium]